MKAAHAVLRIVLEIWFRFVAPLSTALVGFVLFVWAWLGFRDIEADHTVPIRIAVAAVALIALSIVWLVVANLTRFRHRWRSLDYNEDDPDVQEALEEVRAHRRQPRESARPELVDE